MWWDNESEGAFQGILAVVVQGDRGSKDRAGDGFVIRLRHTAASSRRLIWGVGFGLLMGDVWDLWIPCNPYGRVG